VGVSWKITLYDTWSISKERCSTDPHLKVIGAPELQEALGLTPEWTGTLCKFIQISTWFWSGGGGMEDNFQIGIPQSIAEILEIDDLRGYARACILQFYDPDLPIDEPGRQTYSPRPVAFDQVMSNPTGSMQSPAHKATEKLDFVYDLAISFAGPQRDLARAIAKGVQLAGFQVFFDEFQPEDHWGEDLAVYFGNIYRLQSRYCLIIVSSEYIEREWTNHERQHAVARAIAERGKSYILPVKVDPVELPGVSPTIGYITMSQYATEQIVKMLVRKLADR
jgi:hypothetical protein